MRAKEIQHGDVSGRLADRVAQTVRAKACQVEKTLPALCIRKDPAERTKRDPDRVLNRIFKLVNNCQASVKEIMVVKSFRGGGSMGAQ